MAAAALVALTLAAATVYSTRRAQEADRQRTRAVQALARAEAIVDFYQFLLADGGTPGTPLTVDGMIKRSQALEQFTNAVSTEHPIVSEIQNLQASLPVPAPR